MNTSKNKIVVDEIHGCIICANLFNILAVYTPDGSLLDCTVTAPAATSYLMNIDRWLPASPTQQGN